MCGIAGIYDPGMGIPSDRLLRRMLYLLRHRGPDEFGIYRGRGIGLAHARLSIIDLSTGQQPMSNEDDSLWIVFNGEIFNYIELRKDLVAKGHRFRTGSDTEVILHLYEDKGAGALADLNGQFAFAIWNTREKELFLARDRMGIRPLFYANCGREWIFGSEIKAIFADARIRRKLDPVGLDDIFTFWAPLSPRTAFEGVLELPPAHYLVINERGCRLERYWNLPMESDPAGVHPEDYYAEGLRELLIDSTRLQLRADVPVGGYLSGGLDSSVTASLICHYTRSTLHTFSVAFEDPEFDESAKQKIMSEYLGTNHKTFSCGSSDIAASFPAVIWHTEVPILRTAPAPLFQLSRMVRDNSFKVVLTGEGADEILGGYDIFKEAKVRRFIEASPGSKMRPFLWQRLYPYLRNSPTRSLAYARAFFEAPSAPFGEEFRSHAPRWNMTSMGKRFFSGDYFMEAGKPSASDRVARFFGSNGARGKIDPLNRAQEIEIRTLLPGYILSSQGDRMGMAHSVEGRFPFLDHRVVEFSMKIPPNLRLKGLREKHILRKSMSQHLPAEIRNMVKQPYRAPDAKCFLGTGGETLVDEMLSTNYVAETGYFNPKQVETLVLKSRRNAITGFKDNMAFIGILSTQLIDKLFIREFNPDREIESSLVRAIEAPETKKM